MLTTAPEYSLKHDPGTAFIPTTNIYLFALGYAMFFTVAAYLLFRAMQERE